MDTVAVDVGSAFVDLAKWDGHALQLEKLPAAHPPAALPQWLELLLPRKGFEFRFHTSRAEFNPDVPAFRKVLKDFGASGSMYDHGISATTTSFRGARWYADRHRLGTLLALDAGVCLSRCALVEPGGSSAAYNECKWRRDTTGRIRFDETLDELAAGLSSRKDRMGNSNAVCCGGVAPVFAANFAARTGSARVLIPDHAGCMGAIGLLLSPEPFQVEAVWGPRPIDAKFLREEFARLMEELGRAITLAGYDFDDVTCKRSVRYSRAGAEVGFEAPCGPLVRDTDSPNAYLESQVEEHIRTASHETIVMGGAIIRAAVDTRQWQLPPPALVKSVATRPLDDRAVRELAPTDNLLERDALLPGAKIGGPAVIRERFHITVVPDHWTAEVSRAGGVMLRRLAEDAHCPTCAFSR